MATKPLLWAGGAGAVGASLLVAMMVAGSPVPDAVEGGEPPILVAVSAPAPAVPRPPSTLPTAKLRDPEVPAAVPSVRGGAPAGQAGIWSIPAEFAPPD